MSPYDSRRGVSGLGRESVIDLPLDVGEADYLMTRRETLKGCRNEPEPAISCRSPASAWIPCCRPWANSPTCREMDCSMVRE